MMKTLYPVSQKNVIVHTKEKRYYEQCSEFGRASLCMKYCRFALWHERCLWLIAFSHRAFKHSNTIVIKSVSGSFLTL